MSGKLPAMDRLTSERRSWLMSRVRSKNTKPELVVRRLVFSMGYRYRLHGKNLPGTPDLVFPGRKKAIFVNASGMAMPAVGMAAFRNPGSHSGKRKSTAIVSAMALTLPTCRLLVGGLSPSGNAS